MKNKLYFKLKNKKVQEEAFDAICEEQKTVGYYSLPEQDISSILSYGESISDAIENIAVIGIGGSSLGAKAVYEFIKPVRKLKRKLYFFESTDPINITNLLSKINLDKTHFLVISKSGTTVETFAIYKYIYSLQNDPNHYTFITDHNSPLEKYAQEIKAEVLHLPENVGGRFSVLSSVGLVPLALSGIDIQSLLNGANIIRKSFFEAGYI
ncbi:MAG TPA: glucose-6-phosphate isomerase, partial [Epsilonproteobacteria bacterium]|nr:glucose-6-phosphate isomerase [Campylobacterota bacterium]